MSATLEGVPVQLTTAEFMVLEALARSAGRVQGRETLTYQALARPLEPFKAFNSRWHVGILGDSHK
jgi:DNA-binding response OmpR family regulator